MPANKPQTEAVITHTSPAVETLVSQTASVPRKRAEDFGENLLQTMEHFVTLVRRIKRPLLPTGCGFSRRREFRISPMKIMSYASYYCLGCKYSANPLVG